MSKLSEALRAHRIHNTHNLLRRFGGERDVAITYAATDSSRGGRFAHAHVLSVTHNTNPKAHWQDAGMKWFGGTRPRSIPAAKAWVAEHYGITEWAPCPTGRNNIVPAHVRAAAEQFVKENPTP